MVARLLGCLSALSVVHLIVSPAHAQNAPLAPGSVQITPDGANEPTRQSNTGPYVVLFTATSTYTIQVTVQLTCAGRNNVSCVSVVPSQVTLPPGGSFGEIEATYNVGAPQAQGRVVVQATQLGQDSGYYNVVIAAAAAPIVALRNHNGDNRDRSLCLTAGAGEVAAWQCGDLLIAHGLPGYSTLGRERSLTLVYNSVTAVARPAIAASVDETGLPSPNTVFTRLLFSGVAKDSATYNGWAGANRQIVLPHAASSDTTGLYPFTLEITNQYSSGSLGTSLSDSVIVVNRATSPFGSGWWLAGVEELHVLPGNKMLWIGGDGSAKVYRNVATNTWQAAAGGYRDTLVYNTIAATYTRTLRHGVKVVFDNAGRHLQTINRVGQVTTFTWSGSPLRLTSIQVPPGGTGTTYTLTYTTDASRQLDKITDPAGRILDVTIASNRLTQIIDPDGSPYSTSFAYDAAGRLVGRTNRAGFTNRFAYGNGLRLTADSVRVAIATATYAVTTFSPWDERGLSVAPSGNIAVDTGLVYTKIDGPRPLPVGDTAEFWIDRWGAPTRIRDPLGNNILVTRGSSAAPALVSRVAFPDGGILGSGFDSRANLLWIADSTYEGSGITQTVTTSYVYGNSSVPDSPTEVRGPVDTLRIAYNTLGLDSVFTDQRGHKTLFSYFTAGVRKGLVAGVVEHNVPVADTTTWSDSISDLTTSFDYDSLGNQVWQQSPKGLVTTYTRDGYTRVTAMRDPARHLTRYVYDLLNRVDTVTVYDDTLLNGPKPTAYRYTGTGLLDHIQDVRGVSRTWQYDAADRMILEVDELANSIQTYFNLAGLVDSTRTRKGHVIRHTYDAAGRLTQTIYPANGSVPGDTIVRTYDVMGRLQSAINRNTVDSTWYNREGSVRMERQALRNDSKIVQLLDTLRYWYDVGGRRTKLYTGVDTLRYTYGTDGQLAKLKVDWMQGGLAADSFLFSWDSLGRRDRVQYTNGLDVTFSYDRDGHLRMLCAKHPGGQTGTADFLEQRLHYVALDKDGQVVSMRRYQGMPDLSACSSTSGNTAELYTSATYDGRHQVLSHGGLQPGTYAYDGSGNVTSKTISGTPSTFVQPAGTNRLSSAVINTTNFLYTYDLNGSRIKDSTPNQILNLRKFYYNGLGQTVGDSAYWDTGTGFQWHGNSSLYRYDPSGRLIRLASVPTLYFAYDGANVVRADGPQWRYVHGPGTDDPLVAANTVGASTDKYYYLTDGNGRQYAFTSPTGADFQAQVQYTQNGGSQGGGVTSSSGFDNQRGQTSDAPRLSFYRNRVYDQETARWTQEDPIGIAGGTNLYQFNGNSPGALTDPFGLCPKEAGGDGKTDTHSDCPPGTEGYREYLSSMGTIDRAAALVARSSLRFNAFALNVFKGQGGKCRPKIEGIGTGFVVTAWRGPVPVLGYVVTVEYKFGLQQSNVVYPFAQYKGSVEVWSENDDYKEDDPFYYKGVANAIAECVTGAGKVRIGPRTNP